MTSLSQIKRQIEELQQKAAEIQAQEKEAVLAEIRQKIVDYGITPEDLGLVSQPGRRKRAAPAKTKAKSRRGRKPAKPAAKVAYRSPDGQTWGGGRGRKPRWVMDILASGEDLEKYRVRGRKAAA